MSAGEANPSGHAVGSLLRRRREELGLGLAEVSEALRIKPTFLAALEEARPQDLPGPTYAVGFVRAYSHYLGLDSDLVLERYKETARTRPDLALPVPLGERSLPGGRILLVGLILALCGYGTWYYLATDNRTLPERVAAVPAALQPLPAKPEAGPAPPAAPLDDPDAADAAALAAPPQPSWGALPVGGSASTPPAPARTAAATGNAAADPHIEIRALADSWVEIRAPDDTIVFSRVLKTGETYEVPRTGLLLRTGNAGALAITVDGKPAPSLGPSGALRRNVTLDPEALLTGKAARG